MSQIRRRIALQLIPLLDLLLIVLFAQFMQLQELSKKQVARTAEAEKAAAATVSEVAAEREELARLKAELERQRLVMEASQKFAEGDQEQVAAMTAELLSLPAETIRKALAGKTQEEIERLKAALAALPNPKAADIVHQLAIMSELRRACDVWQIHIDDTSIVRVTFPPATTSFRVESPAEFERKLFEWYKALPPPKSVVMIQITWGDVTFGTKYAVKEGIVKCAERMRADRNGRTLFEYIVLGFRPSS